MSIDPKVLQALLKNIPELETFRVYLAGEAFKLNTLDGLDDVKPADIPLEIMARRRAREIIDNILGLLSTPPQTLGKSDPRDYMVEVDDIGGKVDKEK